MTEFNIAYHHYDESICQRWYDSKISQKNKSKIVRFPTFINAEIAKACNYEDCDKISLKKGFYHVVPNVPYSTFSNLAEVMEKKASYKDPANARRLLDDVHSFNLKDQREYSPVAVETLEKEKEKMQKKRNEINEKNERTEMYDAISGIPDRKKRKILVNKVKAFEKKIKEMQQENQELKKNQAEQQKENGEVKWNKRKFGFLKRYKTIAEAKEHDNAQVRQQYKRFAKATGEEMIKSVEKMKGGREDVDGTVAAGLEYLLSKQETRINERELDMILSLKNSIHANLDCEYKSTATSIASLAVELLKGYPLRKIAHSLKIPVSRVQRAMKHGEQFFPGAPVVKNIRTSSIRVSQQRLATFCEFMGDSTIAYDAPATLANRLNNVTHILTNSRKTTCKLYSKYMNFLYPNVKPISSNYIMKYLCSKKYRRQKAQECCCGKCVSGHDAFHELSLAMKKAHELTAELLKKEQELDCKIEFDIIKKRIRALKE